MFPASLLGKNEAPFSPDSPSLGLNNHENLSMSTYAQTSRIINDKDAMLKSICADAPGCYQLGDESGGKDVDFGYAKLVGNGYSGISPGVRRRRRLGILKISARFGLPPKCD